LRKAATIVAIMKPIPTVMSDRADNMVLATAMAADTPFLVSGDRELQELGA
jgi:predicted nucleic acid-binding protein